MKKNRNWTQTLPQGKGKSRKEHFFNPIMQNDLHIKYLKKIIGDDIDVLSVVTFSERCTLKKITVTRNDVKVINRYDVAKTLKMHYCNVDESLTEEKVNEIFDVLYPYTQISDALKQKHIDDINDKYSNNKI